MTVPAKTVQKILKSYYDLRFENSLSGVSKFRQSLARNLDITISEKALRRILKDSSLYQGYYTRRKNIFHRKIYARGVG